MGNNTGWICPKCGKVHAPWVPSCECNNTSIQYGQYGFNTGNTNGIDKMKFVTTCTGENFTKDQQVICD